MRRAHHQVRAGLAQSSSRVEPHCETTVALPPDLTLHPGKAQYVYHHNPVSDPGSSELRTTQRCMQRSAMP